MGNERIRVILEYMIFLHDAIGFGLFIEKSSSCELLVDGPEKPKVSTYHLSFIPRLPYTIFGSHYEMLQYALVYGIASLQFRACEGRLDVPRWFIL